jgi:DDE superfamily endonuclease
MEIVWDIPNGDMIFIGSIDGTHCPIEEPHQKPDPIWYSHKFNGPGLAYQIVVSVQESKILSITGPYMAGEQDITIFRKQDGISHLSSHDSEEAKNYKKRVRARHETLNKRLKDSKSLGTPFRHFDSRRYTLDNFDDHKYVFFSVCVLVQYDLQYQPLF